MANNIIMLIIFQQTNNGTNILSMALNRLVRSPPPLTESHTIHRNGGNVIIKLNKINLNPCGPYGIGKKRVDIRPIACEAQCRAWHFPLAQSVKRTKGALGVVYWNVRSILGDGTYSRCFFCVVFVDLDYPCYTRTSFLNTPSDLYLCTASEQTQTMRAELCGTDDGWSERRPTLRHSARISPMIFYIMFGIIRLL